MTKIKLFSSLLRATIEWIEPSQIDVQNMNNKNGNEEEKRPWNKLILTCFSPKREKRQTVNRTFQVKMAMKMIEEKNEKLVVVCRQKWSNEAKKTKQKYTKKELVFLHSKRLTKFHQKLNVLCHAYKVYFLIFLRFDVER